MQQKLLKGYAYSGNLEFTKVMIWGVVLPTGKHSKISRRKARSEDTSARNSVAVFFVVDVAAVIAILMVNFGYR